MNQLGKYELHETVGAGAMSTVYRAVDTETQETVAVKLLHAHMASAANIARFEREVHALSALKHPGIVGIRGFSGGDGAQHYSILEYVKGQNLAQFLSREREVQPDLAAMVLLELAKATAVAHSKGIVHRDLKPENILIREDGALKISDFGLAYLWEGTDLTMPGTRIGSPAYMSPEQIRGEKPAAAMDVFSLGILFYQMMTGELPFKGTGRRETFRLILNRSPTPPETLVPEIPKAFSELCLRMLGCHRKKRITTADEVVRFTESCLAQGGLAEYEPVLGRFLRNPKETREEVLRELLNAYLKVGRRAVELKDRDRVFDLFRTVLTLTGVGISSPSEEALPTRRVKWTQARPKMLWWLAIALGAAVLFFALI
ncbi:MAG: serine/threonine-protein kinase [Pseudomonadota bacterium]